MAKLIGVPSFMEDRGSIAVIDGILPFPIRRVYYLFGVPSGAERGRHRHRVNRQALVCIAGSCVAHVHDGRSETSFVLDDPTGALLLDPSDWHRLSRFSPGAVLLVLASEPYDPDDYIREPRP